MASKAAARLRIAVIIGGNGALGQSVVQAFKSQSWVAVSVDRSLNASADHNVVLQSEDIAQHIVLTRQFLGTLSGDKADAIVCAAGGWAGGNAAAESLAESLASMTSMCLQPVFTTASLASSHLNPNGSVVLTGAAAALRPTPGMLAYGAVKAATHHVAISLASPESGLPPSSRVLCILPRTLDTPSNRKWMAEQDRSTWTPTEVVADYILQWCSAEQGAQLDTALPRASLVEAVTVGGKTSWVPHFQ